MKFEYLVLTYGKPTNRDEHENEHIEDIEDLTSTLNKFGEQGWELIQIQKSDKSFLYFLKKSTN